MKNICLYFQVHQPFRFRTYRFFDIGNDHYYYDDFANEGILRKVADKCYLPANRLMLKLIKKHKNKFKVAFSISGIAIEQFRLYAPEVLESFKELADTGQVEFLAETHSHSLSSLKDVDEFKMQVTAHRELIKDTFGQEPQVFRNTELIYSDGIGADVYKMGFKGMLTEGAKHILGWKSPNYLYCNAMEPRLKVLLKNFKLSDDIAFRFSNKGWGDYPLTTEKFAGWLNDIPEEEETVNLFMDYETFGEHQWKETGIFDFLEALPETVLKKTKFSFSTPSEIIQKLQVISAVQVPNPISWADEERDLSAWLGNEMQQEAFHKLYELKERVYQTENRELLQDFRYLQISDHFYYMSTKFFSDGEVHSYFNPYATPYEAFMNYMNVLSDFKIRVDAFSANDTDNEIARLSKIIQEKDKEISLYTEELKALKNNKSKKPRLSQTNTVTAKKLSAKRETAKDTPARTKATAKVIKEKQISKAKSPGPVSKKTAKPVGSASGTQSEKKKTNQKGSSKAKS